MFLAFLFRTAMPRCCMAVANGDCAVRPWKLALAVAPANGCRGRVRPADMGGRGDGDRDTEVGDRVGDCKRIHSKF